MYQRPNDENIENWEKTIQNFLEAQNLQDKNNHDVSVNISKMCSTLGIKVVKLDLSDLADDEIKQVDGVILVDNDYKVIGVNEALDPRDARVVIAHELSHYITENGAHQFHFRDEFNNNKPKDDLENQMDYMAAALLVPFTKFKKLLELIQIKEIRKIEDAEKIDKDFINICMELFNVSKDLILRRIVEVS